MHRSQLLSVALSVRAARSALRPRAGALGRARRAAPRATPARSPFQLSVNPSLLALTVSAGCVI
jgi:hypothetical protein